MTSYGFNFKYVNSLKIENLKFDLKCKDTREPIVIEDCENIDQEKRMVRKELKSK